MAGAAGRGRVAQRVAPGEARVVHGEFHALHMDGELLGTLSDFCRRLFRALPQQPGEVALGEGHAADQLDVHVGAAHAHLEAVGIGDGQEPLLVALIGKGDGRADGDAVHAVAVAELVGLGDAGEGIDPAAGSRRTRGPRIPAPRRRRRWHSVPARRERCGRR